MINQERVAAGKSEVGFINPVLYENPAAMTDITSGDNAGCGEFFLLCFVLVFVIVVMMVMVVVVMVRLWANLI